MCKAELDGNRYTDLLFYVLSSSVEAEPLSGLQACDQLNLLRRVAVTTASPSRSESIQKDPVASQYKDLFQGVDCISEYSYPIRLK